MRLSIAFCYIGEPSDLAALQKADTVFVSLLSAFLFAGKGVSLREKYQKAELWQKMRTRNESLEKKGLLKL